MSELLIGILSSAAGLAAAVLIAPLLWFAFRRARASPTLAFVWVMPAMLMQTALTSLLSNRTFNAELDALAQPHPLLGWTNLPVSIFLLGCLVQCLMRVRERPNARDRWLIVGIGIWWLGAVASPALFGRHPYLSHQYLYGLAILLTAALIDERTRLVAVERLRDATLIFIAASVLLVPIVPKLMIDFDYNQGLLSGVPRLVGLASHSVMLATLAVLGLLTMLARPYGRRSANWLAAALFLAALFFAQSKTSWLAGMLCLLVQFIGRIPLTRADQPPPQRLSQPRTGLAVVALVVLAAGLALMPLFDYWFGIEIERFLASGSGQSLLSGTGRDQIWELALEEWRMSPWTGYGPLLFDQTYRELVGMPFATHGHNQLYDTLARSGLIGAAALLFFLVIVLTQLAQCQMFALGLAGQVAILLTFRGQSEVPFWLFNYGADAFEICILLIVLRQASAQAKQFRLHFSGRRTQPMPSFQSLLNSK